MRSFLPLRRRMLLQNVIMHAKTIELKNSLKTLPIRLSMIFLTLSWRRKFSRKCIGTIRMRYKSWRGDLYFCKKSSLKDIFKSWGVTAKSQTTHYLHSFSIKFNRNMRKSTSWDQSFYWQKMRTTKKKWNFVTMISTIWTFSTNLK